MDVDAADDDDDTVDAKEDDPNEVPQQSILLDAWHFMDRLSLKQTPLRSAFFKALREAIFIPDKNDLAKVKAVMAARGDSDVFEYYLDTWPTYMQARVRRVIPSPNVFLPRLLQLNEVFSDLLGFDHNLNKEFRNMVKHVRSGCLSDPPDLQMYYRTGTDADKLPIYRCSRGTSSVESIHQKLSSFFPFLASPELADALLAEKRHRINSRAAVRNLGVYNCHHCDQYLTDIHSRQE